MITDIDLSAPVIVRRETVINAPLRRIWRLHTNVPSWPQWQPDITAAQADCPLRTGTTFRWSTGGLDIESTVYEVEEPRRIIWGGPAHGITGIHLWTFDVTGSAVRVRTEESWDGDPVRADIPFMRAALDQSLAAWLNHLKKAAETQADNRLRRSSPTSPESSTPAHCPEHPAAHSHEHRIPKET